MYRCYRYTDCIYAYLITHLNMRMCRFVLSFVFEETEWFAIGQEPTRVCKLVLLHKCISVDKVVVVAVVVVILVVWLLSKPSRTKCRDKALSSSVLVGRLDTLGGLGHCSGTHVDLHGCRLVVQDLFRQGRIVLFCCGWILVHITCSHTWKSHLAAMLIQKSLNLFLHICLGIGLIAYTGVQQVLAALCVREWVDLMSWLPE